MKELKPYLKDLLSKDFNNFFNETESILNPESILFNEFNLYKARYNKIINDENLGTQNYETLDNSRNKLLSALLNFINRIDSGDVIEGLENEYLIKDFKSREYDFARHYFIIGVLLTSLAILGWMFYNQSNSVSISLSDYDKALKSYQLAFDAREICTDSNFAKECGCPNRCDGNPVLQRKWDLAISKLLEQLNSNSFSKDTVLMLKQNLAYSYFSRMKFTKSIQMYRDLINNGEGNNINICFFRYMIGQSYFNNLQFDLAISFYEMNIDPLSPCQNPNASLNGLGFAYLKRGKQNNSIEDANRGCSYFNQALANGDEFALSHLNENNCQLSN